MTLNHRVVNLLFLGVSLAWGGISAAASIPDDEVQKQKIFKGSSSAFENPGEVNLEKVIAATPEYKEITKDKIEQGTGKYWILLTKATERALKAVAAAAKDSKYDLITAKGYLSSLKQPIDCDDITETVLKKLDDE